MRVTAFLEQRQACFRQEKTRDTPSPPMEALIIQTGQGISPTARIPVA